MSPSLTAQETFDIVKAHLLKQGLKALKIDHGMSTCQYRAPNGLKCAVGCLIPDHLYSPGMEGHGTVNLLSSYPSLREVPAINHHDDLLAQLQFIHDFVAVELWRGHLMDLAAKLDLGWREP